MNARCCFEMLFEGIYLTFERTYSFVQTGASAREGKANVLPIPGCRGVTSALSLPGNPLLFSP